MLPKNTNCLKPNVLHYVAYYIVVHKYICAPFNDILIRRKEQYSYSYYKINVDSKRA